MRVTLLNVSLQRMFLEWLFADVSHCIVCMQFAIQYICYINMDNTFNLMNTNISMPCSLVLSTWLFYINIEYQDAISSISRGVFVLLPVLPLVSLCQLNWISFQGPPRQPSGKVLASSAGGPEFNPKSRTASYQRRYKNDTRQFSCLALNIKKVNTGSFSRIKIRK